MRLLFFSRDSSVSFLQELVHLSAELRNRSHSIIKKCKFSASLNQIIYSIHLVGEKRTEMEFLTPRQALDSVTLLKVLAVVFAILLVRRIYIDYQEYRNLIHPIN